MMAGRAVIADKTRKNKVVIQEKVQCEGARSVWLKVWDETGIPLVIILPIV